MKILVIGSKGFIGDYVYKYFLNKSEYKCWGCDVGVDYIDPYYFLIDNSSDDFNRPFQNIVFDVCINCSGAASVPDSFLHPLRDFALNTYNVVKVLEAIRRYSPSCKFINLSSAAIYGNPVSLPVTEDMFLNPISPYGCHKLFAENLCEEYYKFYNIQTCSIRIFSAYGNGLKKQFFWDLAQKLKQQNKIILFGSGHESRDFIHIEDIVAAIDLIIHKGDFNAASYNIANGEEILINVVAEKLQLLIGGQKVITFTGNQRKGDPLNWKADISKLKSLGYQQKVSIDEGLNKYVAWLREEKLV